MTKGNVFDIMKYAIHDGPGIRTTVFLKGCPLTCLWCHNPESQMYKQEILLRQEKCIACGDCLKSCNNNGITEPEDCKVCGKCTACCPTEAREMVGSYLTSQEVMKEIKKDLIFYEESGGGVTFSGGEPLAQYEFLNELLVDCKRNEIHTTVETTGFATFAHLEKISRNTDLFLYDLKLIDDVRHKKYTGVSNSVILENLTKLAQIHEAIIIRIPIIPGINDDQDNITQTGNFISGLKNIKEINLLPYHKAGVEKYNRLKREYLLKEVDAPTDETMSKIAHELRNFGFKVKIGG